MTTISPSPVNLDSQHRRRRALELLDKPIFFIVGCQKSGTTWLQKLLDAHPQIRCNGEAYFGPILLPVLKQAIELYNSKQKIAADGGFDADDLQDLFATAIALMFSKWVGDQSVQCIGEKTPEHALCIPLLNQTIPHARFIHIIRDGRDVAVSGWFHNLRKSPDKFKQRFAKFTDYIEYLIQSHWEPYIRRARAFGQEHPDRYFELRYEDLHERPQELTTAMLEFLGVDSSASHVQSCIAAGSFQTQTGGRQRGQEDGESFFRKGVVGDFHEHFDNAAIETFDRLGGALLKELGYE